MKRYESYKDSGVEWLGEVPSHWELKRLKQLFVEKKHRQNLSLNCGAISFGKVIEKADDKVTEATKRSYQEVLKGEFLINPLNLNYDLISLRIALSEIDVVVSAGYIVLKEKQIINKKYFSYLLHRYDVAYMKLLGSGVRQTINYGHISDSILVIPPLSEQQKIAQFLDDKTAKIDQAVDLAEKQIALLKEHKQILIQNAVTRGLNPDVPLKDSGVEWIGQVPEHWEVKKLKFVSKINQHTLPENTNGSLSIKYVDIGSVSFENGIEKVENFLFKNAPSRARRLANRGDIVVSTVRTYLKAITMVKEEHQDCIFSTGFAVITSNECLEDNFFELYAKSDAFTEQVSVFSKGMSYPAINSTDLSNLWITVPPISEQQKIADYLETQVSKINQAIALKTAHIEKLKEYKSVLINDAVTGKVRVSV